MPETPESRRRSRVLLVIGHGRTSSFCHHLLDLVRSDLAALDIEHRTQDLLADGFDPVLRLEPGQESACIVTPEQDPLTAAYQQDVVWADAYVIVHPVWWWAPPAILKGWVDRVLVDDVAVRQPDNGGPPQGILNGRRALVIQTFNADRAIDKVVFAAISKRFWKRGVFLPVAMSKSSYFPVYSLSSLNASKLERVHRRLQRTLSAFLGPLQKNSDGQ